LVARQYRGAANERRGHVGCECDRIGHDAFERTLAKAIEKQPLQKLLLGPSRCLQ